MVSTHYYAISHLTTFQYSAPVHESVMETWMQPRSEGNQRCMNFDLMTYPKSKTMSYADYQGNIVHYFNIPRDHSKLIIVMESLVEVRSTNPVPANLSPDTWETIDQRRDAVEFFDMLQPSTFVQRTPLLETLSQELNLKRHDDPLTVLRELNTAIYKTFDYDSDATEVDSPIDVALGSRQGVCQDFAHIMAALVRGLGIPCRYVSGYLFHRQEDTNARSAPDATHAWVEAWLPGLNWVGFDPTNNVICDDGRHIRVGIGRDYADVPPTRGIYKGDAETVLHVEVKVEALDDLPSDLLPNTPLHIRDEENAVFGGSPQEQEETALAVYQQQQQQQ